MTTTLNAHRPAEEPSPGEPRVINQASPYLHVGVLLLLTLAVVGNSVDILLAKATLDVLMNENQFLSAIVAIGIAIVSIAAAAGGGYLLRRGKAIPGIIVLIAWFGIGVALALMRWNLGVINADGNTLGDRVLALLMIAVYLAAGVEIAVHGGALLDRPSALKAGSARRAIRRVDTRRNRVASQYARVDSTLSRFPQYRDRAKLQHQTAIDRIDHIENELMAFTRDQVAERLRDGAQTGVYRQPRVKE